MTGGEAEEPDGLLGVLVHTFSFIVAHSEIELSTGLVLRCGEAVDRIAPAPARRVHELPARRPLSSTSAPAVDHAAALWQLCCRIGRTTTVACQRVGSYARCHHLRPRATGSILGTNSRATQQAGELAAADPANRARLARRLQLAARRRPEKLPRGAPFGVELERAIAHGVLGGRWSVPCADTAPDRRFRTWCHALRAWCH